MSLNPPLHTPPNPRVSVLVPSFNQGKFIQACIDSILTQDFDDFELIVSDDASTDNTINLISSYNDKRITIFPISTNRGMVANWNFLLSQAKGQYVKFVFSDDLLLSPRTLSSMVSVLDFSPEISLVFSSRLLINSESTPLRLAETFDREGIHEGDDVWNCCLKRQKNLIGEPSAVMFRREHSTRGFDARFRQLVDLELWIHLLQGKKSYFLKEPLVAFRIHPHQQTKINNSISDLSAKEMLVIIESYCKTECLDRARILSAFLHCVKKTSPEIFLSTKQSIKGSRPLFRFMCFLAGLELSFKRPFQNLKRAILRNQRRTIPLPDTDF